MAIIPLLLFLVLVLLVVGLPVVFFKYIFPRFLPTHVPVAGQFGNVLATGNGNGNPAIRLHWMCFIIVAIAGCAIFAFYAGYLSYRLEEGEIAWDKREQVKLMIPIYAGVAILCPVLCLVVGIIDHRGIFSTYIQVEEGGIQGKGVGKFFLFGDLRCFGFCLAYNQITSVDVSGSTIIIHATGAQYKCYVQNPSEIQGIIVGQQQKRAGA
jgi:hypothetical protein